MRLSSHTCVLPSPRLERNARNFPSGLQRGCEEETFSAVITMASPPPVGAIQMRVSVLSSFNEAVETVYATHFPSSAIWGSPTPRISKASSTVMARGAGGVHGVDCAAANVVRE